MYIFKSINISLQIESLLMCDYLLEVVVSLDKMTDLLKNWERRLREVVHQFFKFGFEVSTV